MKPLEQLSNVERARLLFQLFPDLMPDLIQSAKNQCQYIIEHENEAREQWECNPIFTFDFWLFYVKDLLQRIEKYDDKLTKKVSLFTDQLFDGYTALAMCHCVLEHGREQGNGNPNYLLATTMLFHSNN